MNTMNKLQIKTLIKWQLVGKKFYSATVFMDQFNDFFHFSRRTKLCTGVSDLAVKDAAMMSEGRLVFAEVEGYIRYFVFLKRMYISSFAIAVFVYDNPLFHGVQQAVGDMEHFFNTVYESVFLMSHTHQKNISAFRVYSAVTAFGAYGNVNFIFPFYKLFHAFPLTKYGHRVCGV